ncbi:MAG: terminase large subunit [Hyphomicrobium sp.]|jgi:phage terminase large subunit-like protein
MWDFSCSDWVDRLKAGRTLVPDLPLDEAEAERAVRIFDKLRLPDVVGMPSMGEAAGDWIRDMVRALFGSMSDEGVRQVKEMFGLLPKKNSKTTNGAGIMITALLMNERPRAEGLLIGPTQEIADLAFNQAAGMIAEDPEGYLQTRFAVRDHIKTIEDLKNGSTLKIKTFDMRVMTGSKPTWVLVDELHVMSSVSYASRVIGQIRGGLLPRPDGFLLFITTQSDLPPAGVFRAELQLARGIRDGRIVGKGASMLPVLYEFPEDMQTGKEKAWENPAFWHMVNPNLGLSITLDALETDYAQAREKGDEEIRRWASQHLNVEIGLALHSDRWRGADFWEDAADPELVTLDALLRRSEVVTIGIDGGGLDDLLGFNATGRDKVTKRYLAWYHAWAQDDVLERRKEIAETLKDFERDGDLTICTTPTQDVEEVADLVQLVFESGLLPEKYGVGLDPQGVAALVDELSARDIETDENGGPVTGVSQGFRLSSAVWGMERKLKDGTYRHSGSAMMNWAVGNAKAEQRGNAVLITKQAAGKSKIDPLIAGFNAFYLMGRNPEAASGGSFWEAMAS